MVTAAEAATVPPLALEKGFKTPSGLVACAAGRMDAKIYGIECTLAAVSDEKGQRVYFMRLTGRAQTGLVRPRGPIDLPRLGYGRTWWWRGIRCSSTARGLTCRNRSRHGFFLGPSRQRIF
jgi:hypothetical protein